MLRVIRTLYSQQEYMYQAKTHKFAYRFTSFNSSAVCWRGK